MYIARHPYSIGRPSRIRYLESVPARIMSHVAVWAATGSEIADYYEVHY